uniref:Reverse transcriptase domain-containing protein n=1 Tax=Tanacetum cinerariifolium TaxID=118510 RepID=A0A699GI92_TANCI|nr:reverse transcriptase domain-containing protein [Tanacetum cinerariifolium]
MRTRSSSNLPGESPPNPSSSNPKRRNRRRSKQPLILEESLVDTMADQRTMAELLRAPTEGYAEAIVVHRFLLSNSRAAHRWLEKEPPRSILPWEDLVSKFFNEFFPLKNDNIRNEISNFQQQFDESFHEAWDRYKDLFRACLHHGFTELHQLDTFYNALNPADQDSSNSATGGNLLERRTQDVLTIIENKSKTSVVTTVMTTILKQFQATPPPASVKSVEEIYVTCGGAHPFFQMNTASTSGSGPLPSNIIANPKGELNAITTRSAIVLDEPFVPIPPPFINPKEDEPLLSNKHKLLELENTPLNENFSAVTLKKLPKKLRNPGKFLILYGFSELKCKSLADLGASINLMPLSVWKKLGIHELISTRMTLELAKQAICTPNGIARDVFVLVGKFTFPADFFIVDYESDPRVSLILERPFLWIARALINEFADELALIIFPPGNDDLPFDIESNLKEIEYLLNHDPIKEMDSILDDSIDESNLADLNDNLVDTMPEMFTDEHALDYSSPPLYDEYDDDLEVSLTLNMFLIDLPRSSDFFPSPEYDSFLFEDFFEIDSLPLTDNKDKVFNLGILIQEKLFKVITYVTPDKNAKKLAISHASLILEDFDPPFSLYELPFLKEVPWSKTLFSFSFENEEKVFKPRILASKGVYSSLLLELSHWGPKIFKVIKILETPMEIFPCFYGEDIRILDVPCLYFYPL